jgi:hypothetical protein
MKRTPAVWAAALATSAALLLSPSLARAQEHSIIKMPGDHPHYIFEAEPHLVVGYDGPFDDGSAAFGFRGTFHIADGFVKSINDSVGVGVGADFGTDSKVFIPIVMQWNFWLTTHWSVFGEPGIGFGSEGRHDRRDAWPILFAGGRYHFTDKIALTMRIGYPVLSVGVSFFL